MCFGLHCFYVIWILIQVEIKAEEEPFGIMAVGSSGLLIYWDQNKFTSPPETTFKNRTRFETPYFKFKWDAVTKKQVADMQNEVSVREEQYQINGLNESTEYHIYITHYNNAMENNIRLGNYSIKGKTALKTHFQPEKPNFKWTISDFLSIHIIWLPCGQERKCNGNEAGTHFSVKYRVLESRQWFKSLNVYNGFYDLKYIFPGKIYEIIVTSENGDLKTDSDSQEVFLKPTSGLVQSVKVKALTYTSVLVSWKPPQHSIGPIRQYEIAFNTFNRDVNVAHADVDDPSLLMICSEKECHSVTKILERGQPQENYFTMQATNQDNYEQTIIKPLKTATKYTVSIIPILSFESLQFGFVYKFEFILPPEYNKIHHLLAKPEFRYNLYLGNETSNCILHVQWLPCGRKFDCENSQPGSAFRVKVKNFTGDVINDQTEEEHDYRKFRIEKNEIVNVTVTSINGNSSSDPVFKLIPIDCSEYALE